MHRNHCAFETDVPLGGWRRSHHSTVRPGVLALRLRKAEHLRLETLWCQKLAEATAPRQVSNLQIPLADWTAAYAELPLDSGKPAGHRNKLQQVAIAITALHRIPLPDYIII